MDTMTGYACIKLVLANAKLTLKKMPHEQLYSTSLPVLSMSKTNLQHNYCRKEMDQNMTKEGVSQRDTCRRTDIKQVKGAKPATGVVVVLTPDCARKSIMVQQPLCTKFSVSQLRLLTLSC